MPHLDKQTLVSGLPPCLIFEMVHYVFWPHGGRMSQTVEKPEVRRMMGAVRAWMCSNLVRGSRTNMETCFVGRPHTKRTISRHHLNKKKTRIKYRFSQVTFWEILKASLKS